MIGPCPAACIQRGAQHHFGFADTARCRRPHSSGETISQIYAVTCGNSLAIKLVVGLTAVLPLPPILSDPVSARIGEIKQLYRHIYWQA